MYVGIVLLVISVILMYYSHQVSTVSYSHVNSTTCIQVLKNVISGPLTGNRLNSLINELGRSLLISIEVDVEYVNGSTVKYGSYIPIGPSGVFIQPIVSGMGSGAVEIFGRSECSYVGSNYVINVFIGEYPEPLYLFGVGVALLITGLALLALGDYLRDRLRRRSIYAQ